MRILVTEDEKDLADAIAKGLRNQGYAVDIAYDGQQALDMIEISDYDLIVLDLNLPLVDGMEVCRQVRESSSRTGILMLTARSSPSDRVSGLDRGADDYLTKPFHFPELLARVRAILRREGESRDTILRTRDLVLDPNSQRCYFNDDEIKLTTKEFAILEYLMRNAGRIVSQEELLEHVWDDDANLFTHSVRVHVMNLRRKLDGSGAVDAISTVKGRGYIL
ncbi:MAG: response regulator transcription factor [Chloroflexi bacterium]|jgi:DNA-binding response OmpR family regulator|nr:response regulator transcription factor [Chloroflexota bacterium]MBT7080197.1 response regulator transcription factor [Chloroflexota bacterium]MBT7290143.1 response regulator transcription factor [Chloroflexota bacterium]